jgi:hypothetical protein
MFLDSWLVSGILEDAEVMEAKSVVARIINLSGDLMP